MTQYDDVEHPKHYTQYPVEVIEITRHLRFNLGNAVKYILRAPFKGAEVKDLRKAKWYLEDLITNFEPEEIKAQVDSYVQTEEFRKTLTTFKNALVERAIYAAMACDVRRLADVAAELNAMALKREIETLRKEKQALEERLKDFKRPVGNPLAGGEINIPAWAQKPVIATAYIL